MIILDLDNTIADDSWRIPFIDWTKENPQERYHPYHEPSIMDAPGNTHLFENTERNIIISTARPVIYRKQTECWLAAQRISPLEIYMRADEDHRKSKNLKADFLMRLFAKHKLKPSDIFCAYDDRPDVIEMYRLFGVNAELVSIHSVCAYTNPNTNKEK